MSIRTDADSIISSVIRDAMPDEAVEKALREFTRPKGRLVLVSIGKAGWQMAKAAVDILGDVIDDGIVITKYGHAKESLGKIEIYEAGHPVPDSNSFLATEKVMSKVESLGSDDMVLFLISGGGSALFEKPLVKEEVLEEITKQLLACGADIVEMNTIRKRLSAVKGGRFAQLCAPAKVFSIVLSDIIGDPLDMIASGPAYPDSSTSSDALEIVSRYGLSIDDEVKRLLMTETPKKLDNVETMVTGSVRELCISASKACMKLGYKPFILTSSLQCIAREAGSFLSSIAEFYQDSKESLAFIAGGETVVHLTGKGKGGRNQEIALSAAEGISDLKDVVVFSLGSDGTDGPTDAAGGIVDGNTKKQLADRGISIVDVLANNDAYNALAECNGLLVTGPTGTNVNDVSVILIRR